MPTYQFNTQNHLRIWFSAKKDVFLNDENQLRLVRFRQKNPRANMTLVYSSQMLSAEAHENLKRFCTLHAFTPLDFDTALPAECVDPIDKDMYQIAKGERDAYMKQEGGNLAAASDLTRLIAPLLVRGTYSDFDTNIEVNSLPETQEIVAPMLLDIGSFRQMLRGFIEEERPLINNDIIGVSTKAGQIDPAAKDLLQRVQKTAIKVYADGAAESLKRLSDIPLCYSSSTLVQYYTMGFFSNLFKKRPNISITDFRLFLDKSTRNIFSSFRLRQSQDLMRVLKGLDEGLKDKLLNALSNNEHADFPIDFGPEEQGLIKRAYAKELKSSLKQAIDKLLYTNPEEVALLAISYQQIKTIDDPDECYRLSHLPITGTRNIFLQASVTVFSGPFLLVQSLMGKDQPISYKALSFDRNHLFEQFNSGQSFRLGTNVKVILDKLTKNPDTVCDSSWLSAGQEIIQNREEKMQHAAKTIQHAWKNHRKNAEGKPSDDPSHHEASPAKK